MKQLLHTCENLIIAGLNDRAFVVQAENSSAVVCELLPPNDIAYNNKKEDHGVSQQAATTTALQNPPSHNEIQAVAIMRSMDNQIWCAVSRYNKSLSLYCVEKALPQTMSPTTVQMTAKRVLCLTFASIPSEHASSPPLHVVIAGDLIGDATAYSLTSDTVQSKVLLGHTASMLTGVQVTCHNKKRYIITCDRDEKIRVSAFPQTFLVEGYLLGHSAFITCIDAAHDTKCVSCSGDSTVRLWNYIECKEIANYETNAQLLPTRVAISPIGNTVAVIYDASHKLDILSGTLLQLQQSMECMSQPLSVKFVSNTHILVLTRDPEYMLEYKQVENGHFTASIDTVSSPAVQALHNEAISNNIRMPTSIMEIDEQSGRIKLEKQDETRGFKGDSSALPWNKVERIQKAKEASSRRNKRRKQKQEHDEE